MKKTLIGLITFLTVISFVSTASARNRKKEEAKCTKQATPLKVSGKFKDWKLPMRADKSTGYYYGITNDNQNLYLEVKMKNRGLIGRAIGLGFKVWIDPNAKGKNVLGINYPQSRMNEQMNHHQKKNVEEQENKKPEHLTAEQIKKRREELIEKFNLRYLTGREMGKLINFDKEGLNDAYFGEGDINAIFHMNDQGEIIYEAIIPLKSIFKNKASYLSKGKPFSLILETGAFQQQNNARNMYSGVAGGMSRAEMYGDNFGRGGEMGQGIGGEGYRMGMGRWGGMGIQPVRFKLKRVVLFQYK
jgi:hypothetical protein